MDYAKIKIPSSQITFLIASFIIGSTIVLSPISAIAKHDGWISLMIGSMIGFLFMLIYVKLAHHFSGKTLIEMNDIIYGPYLGKCISIAYLYFFLVLLQGNIGDYPLYLRNTTMPQTPEIIFVFIITIVCAIGVFKGLEVISRCNVILLPMGILVIAFIFILLIKDMNFSHFLPVFKFKTKEFIQSTHIVSTIPYGELVVFLMIFTSINKPQELKKSALLGVFIGVIGLLVIFVNDIAVLGDAISIEIYPTFQTVRMIDVGKIFTRLEALYSVNYLFLRFVKISILYYAIVIAFSQLFKLRTYKSIVLILAMNIIIMGLKTSSTDWPLTHNNFFSIPFELLIPAASLLIVKMRKIPKTLPQKGGNKSC